MEYVFADIAPTCGKVDNYGPTAKFTEGDEFILPFFSAAANNPYGKVRGYGVGGF